MEGWTVKPLADLCEFHNGLWKGKKPPYIHVGVIRNTNFDADGSLDDTDIAFLNVEEKQFTKRQLQYGDLILEKSGGGPKQPVGRVIIFDKTEGLYSFSNFTSVVRVVDPSVLDFRYLHGLLYWYYVSGVTEGMQRWSTGIRNLDFKAYKRLSVPVPSLPEQKRIVAILDDALEGIGAAVANAEKNLANARELFDSYLNNVFTQRGEGWVEETLGDVSKFENGDRGKNYPGRKAFVETGVPFINAGHLTDDGIDMESMNFIPKERFDLLTNGKIQDGDLLFCLRGSLGKFAVVEGLKEGAIASSLVIVRPGEKLNKHFLAAYFGSRICMNMIEKFEGGAAQPNLSARSLRLFQLPLPSIRDQLKIAAKLSDLREEVRRLQTNYQQKLDDLAELKQSVLQKAFSGELTRNSNEGAAA